MHLRPYQTQDLLALVTIKANCDLSDPLALFCRRLSPRLDQQHQTEEKYEKQWRANVKSLRRSLELELLFAGTVCWVVVLDDNDNDRTQNPNQRLSSYSDNDTGNGRKERIVGFAMWSRHGSSSEARKWKAEGNRLSRRIKALIAYIHMTITYPFDKSINHTRMAKFQQRIRSSSPQSHQHNTKPPKPAKERWELEALYIHPRYQRRGYGSLALQWGIETARKENVEIWVWSTQAGKRLYLSGGFETVGRIGFEDLVDMSLDDRQRPQQRQQEERQVEGAAVWAMIWKGP